MWINFISFFIWAYFSSWHHHYHRPRLRLINFNHPRVHLANHKHRELRLLRGHGRVLQRISTHSLTSHVQHVDRHIALETSILSYLSSRDCRVGEPRPSRRLTAL